MCQNIKKKKYFSRKLNLFNDIIYNDINDIIRQYSISNIEYNDIRDNVNMKSR